MAKIPHTALFDFPAYERAIKEVKDASVDFGKAVDTVLDRIGKKQKEVAGTLHEYAEALKHFNVAQTGAKQSLTGFSAQVDQASAEMKEMKVASQGLAQYHVINAKTIKQVEAEYKGLVTQLKNLKPYQGDYQAQVERINNRFKEVIPRLDQFKNGLKNTTATIRSAEGSYRQMQHHLGVLRTRLRDLPNAFDSVTGKINKQNREAMSLHQQIVRLDTALKGADKSMGLFHRNVGNYSSALSGVGSYFSNMIAPVTVIIQLLNTFSRVLQRSLDVSQRFESLNIALGIVSDTSENFALNMNFLNASADKYGQDIFTLTEAYKGLAAATRGSNIEGAGTRKVFEGVVQAGTALKLSNDQIRGSLLAIQQMFSKGTVQAEELRGQLGERLPGAFKLFAESLNVSEQQLNKMLEQGQVLANDALPKFAARLSEVYGADAIANADALVNETNRLENAINRILDSKSVTSFWSTMKRGLAGFFEDLNYYMSNRDKYGWGNLLTLGGRQELRADRVADEQRREKDLALFTKIEEKSLVERLNIQELYSRKTDQLAEQRLKVDEELAAKRLEMEKELAIAQQVGTKEYIKSVERRRDVAIEAIEKRKGALTKEYDRYHLLATTIEDINKRLANAPATSAATSDAARKKALDAFKKTIKDQQDLLKAGYDLDLAELDLALAKKEISEQQYQEKKYELGTTYAGAALAKELELGEKADRAKILAFKKLLVDMDRAREDHEEKQFQKLQKGTRGNFQTVDPTTAKRPAFSLADALEPGLKGNYESEMQAEQLAYDVIRAGRDTNFREELAHLERMKAIKLKHKKDTAEEEYAIERLYAEKDRELRLQTEQFVFDALQTGLTITQDQFNARFEERIAKLESEKQRELELAGNNAQAKEAIENKYNKRIAQEKTKQARTDKVFSLFNVAINTAQGVAKTIAQWGMPFAIPFIALTLGAGALQAAAIAAKPIPKYKKGKERDGRQGLGIWGEDGFEIMEKKGKMYLADKPTLSYMEGDEKIHTHEASKRLVRELARQEEINRILQVGMLQSRLTADIRKSSRQAEVEKLASAMKAGGISEGAMRQIMTDAVKSIPIERHSYDERGHLKHLEAINERRTYLNAR